MKVYYKRPIFADINNPADDDYWDELLADIDQEFTSENTSINDKKLPAIFSMISFQPGTINVDYGGGRFDNVAEYLVKADVINLVFDPYNRTPEHNKAVIDAVRAAGGADTATLSNVLNVIKESEIRLDTLRKMKKMLAPGGTAYITVYEGSKKNQEGGERETSKGYQMYKNTAWYMDEVLQVFPNATRKGKLIVASK